MQGQNLYFPPLRFNLFHDTAAGVSAVSLTIGERVEIPTSSQGYVHMTERCLLYSPQSSFSGRSLTDHLRMKGARCIGALSSNQITIAAASATLPVSEMIADILLALRLDSLTDAELRRQLSGMYKQQEISNNNPGEQLENEMRAILCVISKDDCIDPYSIIPTTLDDWMPEYRLFVKEYRNQAPFLIGAFGNFEESEIKGTSELGLYDYLQKDNPDPPLFEAIAPPERSHYFSLINENVSVPEMSITWVAKYSGVGKLQATGRIAARMAEIISRDILPNSPFESMRIELKPFTGFALFQIHAIPELTNIQSATDSLPQFLARLCDPTRWTEEVLERARNMERMNEKHSVQNPIRLLISQSHNSPDGEIFSHYLDSISLDEIKTWTGNHIDSKAFVAGIVIGSQLNDFMGVEELFASADKRSELQRLVNPNPWEIVNLTSMVVSLPKISSDFSYTRIFLQPNSSALDNSSIDRVYKVCQWLGENPEAKLYVNGYADSQGDGVKNYKLSIQRAEAVRTFMMDNCGVPQSRLLVRPYGEAFPEFEETSPENIRKNRRVTFEIAPNDATEKPY